MSKDYLGMVSPDKKNDAVQYGIRGMKWGQRRTDAQLASDQKKRAASGEDVTPTGKRSTTDGPESTSQRYSRLKAQAKAGGSSQMSEEDLKFFNARTDALNKINKVTQTEPSWFAETGKKVLRQTAQTSMQAILDGVAKEYISGPILDSVKKKPTSK